MSEQVVKRYDSFQIDPVTGKSGNVTFVLAADYDALHAEAEALRGLTPELPPRPPEGAGLPRYGLRWNGPSQPLSVPMDDGYWTPWHLAESLRAENGRLREERDSFQRVGIRAMAEQGERQEASQDVRGLVEALGEAASELEDWRMSFPDANATVTDGLLVRIDGLIAAHRQAQRQ